MRALDIASTGMSAQQTRVETISNNLANMSTTAYNARRAEFADLHYQQVRQPGAVSASNGAVLPTGVQLGLGVRAAAISMDVSQGALRQTGGDLDIAIEGDGYLEIELPSGASAYTRDGALKRTGDGLIVTSEGYPLIPEITIPEDARSIAITAQGEVTALFNDQINAQTRFLYSGTLALKHNPMLLAGLANSLDEGQEVVLVSAGVGADFLRDKVTNNEVRNLRILPLQSFDIFDQVLASGDVLLAVIEREAGTFSVPSKILSYLCAGRPIVLAAPKENLAAQILRETGAGLVVEPEDVDGFRNAALQYANDPDRANAAGKAGRRYAEENFDLSKVASRFEMLFEQLVAKK